MRLANTNNKKHPTASIMVGTMLDPIRWIPLSSNQGFTIMYLTANITEIAVNVIVPKVKANCLINVLTIDFMLYPILSNVWISYEARLKTSWEY